MNRIHALLLLGPLLFAGAGAGAAERAARPNFVIVFTDDQGYGDLGCYGSKTIRSPRLDKLAEEGTRFTDFYAQVVCGPSRSALLTGRYPVRSQGWSMPASEITLAELLQQAGYTTGCIGKWDVSNRKPIKDRMPNAQGFDYYYGTLGANDGGRVTFHENDEQASQTNDMASLTRIYTDKGIEFLKQNKDKPFLLYVAHTMVHSVIDASPEFKGKSKGGLYDDTVEELDFHTGRLLDAIDELGLRDNTLVIFTTDNGPWNNMQEQLRAKHKGAVAWGSSGPLREGKGSTYEGGLRVPCIVRWPGRVAPGGVSDALFATVDFMPTFAALAGFKVPDDRVIDGVDQTALLLGKSERGAREDYYYFCQGELHGVRKGKWKLLLPNRKKFYGYVKDRGTPGAELYDLEADIGETKNLAAEHPAVVAELLKHAHALPLPAGTYQQGITPAPPKKRAAGPRPDVPVADFTKNPLPQDWAVEGYAFGARKPGAGRQQAVKTTANQQQYQFGKLTSPEFTIERDYLALELGGVYHPEKCCVALVVAGKDVRRVSPRAPRSAWSSLDVRELAGKKARLEARDNHFNGWLQLGKVLQTDQAPSADPQTAPPSWEPAVFEARIDQPFLLLPVGGDNAPLQAVTLEIDGKKKLEADITLAMSASDNYLPAYDLTEHQGATLRVRYHQTADSQTKKLIRLAAAMPKREPSDDLPAFHIHCQFGKLNDPNGLVFYDGQYHLYHQYFYGPRGKHWAHYVSTDLMHWSERPIALFPDETGSMHSGGAAVDWHNSGGFQSGDRPAIIAAFTGSRGMGGGDKIQVQGIAYSTDGGNTFTKYAGNPVLGAERLKTLKTDHSRDPKIFWYSPTRGMDPRAKDGHWVMVLFEDVAHSTFTSTDTKTWRKQGDIQGFHECPELFPLAIDGNLQDVRWVMYGANGEYHVGEFDGKTFKPETAKKIRFNHGGRHYAAQTFSNTPGAPPRRIQVGWQSSQISFPVELSLRTTPLGPRLCALPVAEIEKLYSGSGSALDGRELKEGDANPLASLESGLYDIELGANVGGAKRLELSVRGKTIRYETTGSTLSCGKSKVQLPAVGGRLKLRIIVDNCSVDIHAGDGGLFYLPMFFGPLKAKGLDLQVKGGSVKFDRLRVHELKSIWR